MATLLGYLRLPPNVRLDQLQEPLFHGLIDAALANPRDEDLSLGGPNPDVVLKTQVFMLRTLPSGQEVRISAEDFIASAGDSEHFSGPEESVRYGPFEALMPAIATANDEGSIAAGIHAVLMEEASAVAVVDHATMELKRDIEDDAARSLWTQDSAQTWGWVGHYPCAQRVHPGWDWTRPRGDSA